MKKIICYIIWLVLNCVGAITAAFIPNEFQYIYGFIFGSICLCALDAAHLDD